MSELEQNLSNNALMLVVEMLAAKELYDSTRTTEDFEFLCEKRKALESYIAELEEKQRWIPVSERLPEENQIVAVIDTCGNGRHSHISSLYEVAAWVKVKGDKMFRFIHGSNWSSCDVTHWMPMPTLPEVQE